MKRRSLIAIILAVVCLMTSLSVYAADTEKCETCGPYEYSCSREFVEAINMSHQVKINGKEDTCEYKMIVYKTKRKCTVCETEYTNTNHRHAELDHICGRVVERCPYND